MDSFTEVLAESSKGYRARSIVLMADEHTATIIASETSKRGRNTMVSMNLSRDAMLELAEALNAAAAFMQ